MSYITVNNLSFKYNNQIILNNLNFNIIQGNFIALIGVSGCGKSTLIKILAKVINNYSGIIKINGHSLLNYPRPLAYMPQNHLLIDFKTVLDNLSIPLLIQGKTHNQAKSIILPYLEEFGLQHLVQHYPNQLSGGQKQRVALLRSILLPSNILLLDEPFSQVDAITRIKLQQFLRYLYLKYNYTIILVTHDMDEAILLANKVYLLSSNGSIYQQFKIDLPTTRNTKELLTSQFLTYKKNITEQLLKSSQ